MCVTDRHDMTLAVKVALNPNTTIQRIHQPFLRSILILFARFFYISKPLKETQFLIGLANHLCFSQSEVVLLSKFIKSRRKRPKMLLKVSGEYGTSPLLVENIVRKGENAGYQHFLLFPTIFSKGSLFRVV